MRCQGTINLIIYFVKNDVADNWVEWLEWVAMADDLTESTKHLKKKGEWTKDELLEFQDHVITQLYKHYPVRNDYHDTKIISKREYNTLKDNDKKSSNYVVLGRPMMLILNEYKTSKKYGEKIIKIDATVANSIRIFLKHNTSGFLLVSPTHIDRPINSNGITKTLQRISAEHFDGKKIGSSLIRHINHTYPKPGIRPKNCQNFLFPSHLKELATFRTH